VPVLQEDEAALKDMTVRQVVERHSSDAKCVVCHRRIDPFGFALERYDAIGRWRDKDLAGRPVATATKSPDGHPLDGVDGLEDYLASSKRDVFIGQFCRKLLGYALGRSVQLSDEPLLAEIQTDLKANDYRVQPAVDAIVRSRQFREIRGRETP
jgi:hypothetical protein